MGNLGSVHVDFSVEGEHAKQLPIFSVSLQGVGERGDVAGGSGGSAGLADEGSVGVVVGGALTDAVIVVEESADTASAVAGGEGAGGAYGGAIVAGDLIAHEVGAVDASGDTRCAVVVGKSGGALLYTGVVGKEIARVAGVAEGGVGAIVATVDTKLAPASDQRAVVVDGAVLNAPEGRVEPEVTDGAGLNA